MALLNTICKYEWDISDIAMKNHVDTSMIVAFVPINA